VIIRDDPLGYLIGGLVSEGSGEDEDDLVLRGAAPLKDVLQHARQPHAGQRLPDLLPELTVHRVERVLAELDMAAERPVKQLPRRVASSDTSSAPSHGRRIIAIALTTWPLDSTGISYHSGPSG
jgi:hypothetical protein